MVKVIYNSTCSKSRAVLEYLDENNVPFEIIDILAHPLSVLELRTLIKKLGLPVSEIIRKNEPLYREKYAGREYSEEQWLEILSQSPSLIERPILIKGSAAMIARPLENVSFFIFE